MKPFHKLLDVRPDVRDGTLDQSAYAASLGDVVGKIDKPVAKEYRDPESFRKMTYETEGMRKALDDIRRRLQEGRGNGVRQIETNFGGGKTHAMIAMYHECRKWGANPVVIDGQALNPSNTLWGEIERQLDGDIYEMTGNIAPSGDQIYELLGNRKKPVLILIDEIFNYVKRASGKTIGSSDLGDQTITFMQNLGGQMGSMPNVCMVMTLSNKDDVLDMDAGKTARKQNEYYEKLQNVTGRQRQLVNVSDYNDISHIIRRRLFETEESLITDRAQETIQYCMDKIKEGGLISADDVKPYTERFGNTYPFTPDVIDILHKRWGSYPTFQRTRGVLRLLSLVVHSMLKSKREWISPADINLSNPSIREELLQHTEDNAKSVVDSDIVGDDAKARKADGDAGIRCAISIFMYSFPRREGHGVTLEEVQRASFTDKISHWVIGSSVGKIKRRCFYLDETDEGILYFDINPGINSMIENAKRNVTESQLYDAERKLLDGARDGGKFKDVHIWPDETHAFNIPDRPVLQLIICKKNDPEWCKRVVDGTTRSRRTNMNGLVFVVPTDGIMLSDVLSLQLGAEAVHQHLKGKPEYTSTRRSYVTSEISRARESQGDELCKKYSVVYIPDREEGVVKFDGYMFNPHTESNISLDDLMWRRLVRDNQIAVEIAPDIARGYGDDPNSAYDAMIRIPGNVMPASLEVVRDAFEEDDEPEIIDIPPVNGPTGGGSSGGGTLGGSKGKSKGDGPGPEITHDSMTYTDVVDAVGVGDVRSMLLAPRNLTLNGFTCKIDQRPDGMYDVRLEMSGRIPDSFVSGIRPTERGSVKTGGWGEQ